MVEIDLFGDTGECGPDCPSFLAKWVPWWEGQTARPVALLRSAGRGEYLGLVGPKGRNMVRKADRLYTFGEFSYNSQLDGIYAVNTSREHRQGKPMTPRYRVRPEPIRRHLETCPGHRSSWWGAWDKASVELRGYVNLVILGDLGVVNTVLGHADAPAVMNGLFYELATKAPVRWIHYLTLASSSSTLAGFKRRVGFSEHVIRTGVAAA